jgi:hypothetical protein
MVTQITLNTEPHGLDPCQGHSYEKVTVAEQAPVPSPLAGMVADTGPRWWNPTRLSHEPLRSRTAQSLECAALPQSY